jgi:Gpi18-like mannosyltransferase
MRCSVPVIFASRVIAQQPVGRSTPPTTRNSVRTINWIVLALLLLAVVAAVPIWAGPGIINTRGGGDSPFLFFRLHQLVANLHDGVFPARWMPDAAYGLGYPFFNYYASLSYYFAAIFNLIGFDLLVSIKIVQTLGFVFAGLAMYRWADRRFNVRWAAWLAAVAYVFAPFHFVNVYVRGDSLSEFYAFVFYPLILLSIDRVIESPRSFGWLALAYGGLILTHNVSALIFSPFALLYALIQLPKSKIQNPKSKIVALVLGFLLAFALSAWFWLPALGEANLAQLDNQTTGYFNYAEHFRSTDLVQSSLGFNYSIDSSNTPFAMGLVQAMGTVVGLIALIVTWKRDSHTHFRIFVLIGSALSTFMITPLSRPLWDNLPLLPFTQFPWRFLSIQALFTSLAIGYLAWSLVPRRWPLVPVIGLILAATAFLPLHPDYMPIRADEITPERLQLYEAFTSNIGTTIRAEYLPRTTIPRPYAGPALIDPSSPPSPIVSRGVANAYQAQRTSIHQQWQVTVSSDNATLSFPLLYWPGWIASMDGRSVEVRPAPDLGYIQIDVPRGEHRVEFALTNTPLRAASELISLLALGVLLTAGVFMMKRGLRRFKITHPFMSVLLLVLVTGALALIYQASYVVPARSDDLTMDFADKPWLHNNPDGVDFDGLARLRSYAIASTAANAASVNLDLQVTTSKSPTGTLALVAPSTHLFGGPRPLAEQTQVLASGWNTYTLSLPYSLSAGLYYVRVQIGVRTEYLKPIWINSAGWPVPLHAFGALTPAIGLSGVLAQHLDPDRLDLVLQWAANGTSSANYGISLRLRDASGKVWTSLDTQPGYGFLPTSAWQPGAFNDVYTLSLPNDLPRDQTYSLDVILYRVASQQEVGRTAVEGLRVDRSYPWRVIDPPRRWFGEVPIDRRVDAVFADRIQLLGYDFSRDDHQLKLNLAWKALRDIDTNYKVFVHVFDPATETIVAQWDAMPRSNAYPTSRWLNGEVIADPIVIPLTNAPPGSYRVAIGLLDDSGRLPVSGTQQIDAANRRVILDEVIDVH